MRRNDRIAFGVVVASLLVAALGIGGALRWGIVVGAAVALAGAAFVVFRSSRRFETPPPLLVLLGIACAATALQLVPLPAGLVARIAPATHELVVGNAELLGRSAPDWMVLSLDFPSTVVELAKLFGYFAIALLALRVSASRRGRRSLVVLVAAAGGLMALIGLVHYLVDAEELFGIYEPSHPRPFLSPLLNPNHFSGLLAMSVPAALSLALEDRGWSRPLWLSAAGLSVGVCLALMSRGGAIALGVAIVVAGVLAVTARSRPRERRERSLTTTLPTVIVVACGFILVATFTSSRVVSRLQSTSLSEVSAETSKFGVWRSGLDLLSEHRWTGVGRGAFETVFTRMNRASANNTYSHVENEYLQAAVDWGVIWAAALAVAFAWVCFSAARRCRAGPIAGAAAGGLAAILFHNAFDFSLELPGVALPAILLAATLTYVPLARVRSRDWHVRIPALACAVLVVAVAASPFARRARADGARLAAVASDPSAEEDHVLEVAEDVMVRHPADYHPPAIVARYFLEREDTRAAVFLNRAILLHPTHPGLHRMAARMLLRTPRPAQASIEYADALRYARDFQPILDEVLRVYHDGTSAVEALPRDLAKAAKLVRALLRRGRPDIALAYLERLEALAPDDVALLGLMIDAARHAERPEVAERAASRLLELDQRPATAAELAAAVLAQGRIAEAEKVLDQWMARAVSGADKARLLSVLADVHVAAQRPEPAREALRKALGLVTDAKAKARFHRRLARIERQLGNEHQAEWEESRARELAP